MPLARLRAPTRVLSRRMPSRLASTTTRPPLKYKGRIPNLASPRPGPGETRTPDSQKETDQARRAIIDSIQHDRSRDYKKRYTSALWKWTFIICGTPIAIVLTPYLYKRVFLGEERKRLVVDDDDDDEDLD